MNKDDTWRKIRLSALRRTLSQHLYEDRLDVICEKVFGVSLKKKLPEVWVYCKDACHPDFERQTYAGKHICPFGEQLPARDTDFVAVFDAECSYGENYLLDLILSTRYSSLAGFAKPSELSSAYRTTSQIKLRSGIVRVDELRKRGLKPSVSASLDGEYLAIDEFNFSDRRPLSASLRDANIDFTGSSKCFPHVAQQLNKTCLSFTPAEIIDKIRLVDGTYYSIRQTKDGLRTVSSYNPTVNGYVTTDIFIPASMIGAKQRFRLRYHVEGSPNLSLLLLPIVRGQPSRLYSEHQLPDSAEFIEFPPNVASMRVLLRIEGSGESVLDGIVVETAGGSCMENVVCRSDTVVVSNIYPSYDDLYRNMFVHTRVSRYYDAGHRPDMICVERKRTVNSYTEFEGVPVVRTGCLGFASVLDQVKTVCIHFLFDYMWDVLKTRLEGHRIVIWCHGSDIQPWWRRECNYASAAELDKAKIESKARMSMWREVFEAAWTADIQFVFVSEYFAHEVMDDYKIELPKDKYVVIHNLIDTEMFSYTPKPVAQRLKLLSIRPYASRNYANDLTVKMILELQKESFFDQLEFRLIGQGVLFDDTVAPVRDLPNVVVEDRFLTHAEVKTLHKDYGVFICPTRLDTQGVSKDEAMSSGLVVVSNAVTAIPEFCDESCAILAPGEDYKAMAAGVKRLYENPEEFAQMSAAAAARVRAQTSYKYTAQKEIDLIWQTR